MKFDTLKSDIKAYFLVLDKNGMPLVDDLDAMPKQVWDSLSEDQKQFLKNNKKEEV